jgi:hypothetical protein
LISVEIEPLSGSPTIRKSMLLGVLPPTCQNCAVGNFEEIVVNDPSHSAQREHTENYSGRKFGMLSHFLANAPHASLRADYPLDVQIRA